MSKDWTELVFILDRSGSMSGLENDTIGGYNALLKKQQREAGQALITTVLFDNQYELLHDRKDLHEISPITDKDYYVRGTTALLDAIGFTVSNIANMQKRLLAEERAKRVMFVITTDGMENASREYTYEKVRQMIEYQKSAHEWEFLFLGANIDAMATAEQFGIDRTRATNYHADRQGTKLQYEVISETVSSIRANKPLSENWKARLAEDYDKRRSGRK